MRDDFSQKTKDILAKRVGYHCSNPDCRHMTIGPGKTTTDVTKIGVASHICAASPGGPRFDATMSSEERKSIENGIWLCQNCARLIDSDDARYTVELLNNWKQEAEQQAQKGISSSVSASSAMVAVANAVVQYGLTLTQVEDSLKSHTATDKYNYNIDLDFFDYEQVEIENNIVAALRSQQLVRVRFHSREEGIYYILRIIKCRMPHIIEKVLVVETESNWQKLAGAQGLVLMPMFVPTKIDSVQDNKYIIILTEEDFDNNKPVIVVPNRTRNNLYSKLNKYVNNHDKTHELIEKTSGVFFVLMREISDFYIKKPQWLQNEDINLVPAALVGAWSDKTGDKYVIAKLAKMPYEDYEDALRSYLHKEDPFIIRCCTFEGCEYRVSNNFEAIHLLKDKITREHLCILGQYARKVLAEPKKRINLLVDSGNYSHALKRGILKTLIVMSMSDYVYGGVTGNTFSDFAISTVNELLDNIKAKEEWEAISELLPVMVEAAPEEVLDRLELAVEEDEVAFWSLFENKNAFYFPNDAYVGVLDALTVALFLENVSIRALLLLERLADKDIEYKLGNSPVSILVDYFNGRFYEVNITSEEKIEQLENFTQILPAASWKVLKRVLPRELGGSVNFFRKPIYRTYKVAEIQCITDAKVLYAIGQAYFRLAFKCAGKDLKKWAYFFENKNFLLYELNEELICSVQHLLQDDQYSDEEKYFFEKSIRNFLYNIRYFKNECRYGEDKLVALENSLLNIINYKNPVFKILYAFDTMRLDIHPIPSDEDKAGRYLPNTAKKEVLQKNLLSDIENCETFSLEELVARTVDSSDLGSNIFEVCHNKVISVEFAYFLFTNKKMATLHGYLSCALSQLDKESFCLLYKQVAEKYKEPSFKFHFLETQKIDDAFVISLDALDKKTAEFYWANTKNTWYDSQNFIYQCDVYIGKLIKYGNISILSMNILLENFNVSLITYISLLISISKNDQLNNLQYYDIMKIFEKIYSFAIIDTTLKDIVIQLEMIFIKFFYETGYNDVIRPKYLLEKLKTEPEFSAMLLTSVNGVKTDENINGTESKTAKEKWASISANVIDYVKFCPCEENGQIDEDKLIEWCKVFLKILKDNGLEKKGQYWLGRFLANCPLPTESDIWPLAIVCNVIENLSNKDFAEGFLHEIVSNKGGIVGMQGMTEMQTAEIYDAYARQAQLKYGKTAKILHSIAAHFRGLATYVRNSELVYE